MDNQVELYKVIKGSKGARLITIPLKIRKHLNVEVGDTVTYLIKNGDVVLKKVTVGVE